MCPERSVSLEYFVGPEEASALRATGEAFSRLQAEANPSPSGEGAGLSGSCSLWERTPLRVFDTLSDRATESLLNPKPEDDLVS